MKQKYIYYNSQKKSKVYILHKQITFKNIYRQNFLKYESTVIQEHAQIEQSDTNVHHPRNISRFTDKALLVFL